VISIHRVLEHRARAVVALLALALVALALGACGSSGGSSSGGGGDAAGLLKTTFANLGQIKSGKANLQLTVDVQGDASLRGPIKLGLTGPFQSEGSGKLPQFDLAIDATFQGQGFQAGLTSTSDRMFVQFGGAAYEVPAALMTRLQQSLTKANQQSGGAKGKLDLHALGIDWIGLLKNPTVVGTDTIGGVATKHVSGQLNVSALLDAVDKVLAKVGSQSLGATGQQLPKSIPAKTRSEIEDAIKSASIDVWTGASDKIARKLSVALAVRPKNPGSGPTAVNLSLSLELQDLNAPQAIKAPSSPRPLSDLLGSLQGLLGGGAGSLFGGGGSSGGSSSGGGSSKQLDKYTQCLQKAGSDVAKAQNCAALLSQ
jgi:hypothetical protein